MKETQNLPFNAKTLGHYLIVNLHYYYAIIWPTDSVTQSLHSEL